MVVLGEISYILSNSNKLEVNEIIQEGISKKEELHDGGAPFVRVVRDRTILGMIYYHYFCNHYL